MKIREIILIAFILIFAVSSIAGQIRFRRGTNATKPATAAKGEPLVTTDTQDLHIGMSSAGTYQVNNARNIRGGYVQYQTSSQCRNIPGFRAFTGMMCYSKDLEGTTYGPWRYYKGGATRAQIWQRAPLIPKRGIDYWDGNPGPQTLFCNVTGGLRSFEYDSVGLNPPAQKRYGVVCWLGGAKVNNVKSYTNAIGIKRWVWTTPGSNISRHIFGSSTSNWFTPTVQGHYSAGRTAWVGVQVQYSSTAMLGGKRIVTAGTPVTVTKPGQIGEQGIPGTDATVTEAAVITAFSTTASNNPLVLAAGSGNPGKLQVWDTGSNVRNWIDSFGNQYWQMADETVVVKILTDGSFVIMRGGKPRFEVTPTGTFNQYLPDGVTKVFRCFSSGVCYGSEGLPASNGLCMSRDKTTGVTSYIPCDASAVKYAPYSTYVTVGSQFGSYTSTRTLNSRYLGIKETTSTPGFTYELLFKNVADFNTVEMYEQYKGNPAHNVDIQIYNYLTSSWQTLGSITDQSSMTQKIYTVLAATPYLSNTQVRLRFNHTSAGATGHVILTDYIALSKEAGTGTGMGSPYTIPGAVQTFVSQGGRVRFSFYSAAGLVVH